MPSLGIADWRNASRNTLAFLAFSGNRYLAELWVKSSWFEGEVGTILWVCLTVPSCIPTSWLWTSIGTQKTRTGT